MVFQDHALWKEAEELALQVIEMRSTVLGERRPDTLTGLAIIVSLYLCQGRLAEAEKLGKQVLEARMEVLGPEDLDTLAAKDELVSIYHD